MCYTNPPPPFCGGAAAAAAVAVYFVLSFCSSVCLFCFCIDLRIGIMAAPGSCVRQALSDRAATAEPLQSKKTQQQNQVSIHFIMHSDHTYMLIICKSDVFIEYFAPKSRFFPRKTSDFSFPK